MKKCKLFGILVVIICLSFSGAIAADQTVCGDDKLIAGSGDEKGTYGVMTRNIQAVCPSICEYKDDKTGELSSGGFMNANLLTKRKIDIGMIPEDVLELTKRTDPLVVKMVRVLGALHTNALHIIVPKGGIVVTGGGFKVLGFDTGVAKSSTNFVIKDISDLKNGKMAVYASALVTMTLANERLGYNIQLEEVKTKEEGFKLLNEGKVLAFATTGGWPIPWVDTADSKKYTLANVSDQDIRKMGAPFYPVTLNYQTLGAYGVSSFGARNVLAVWNYTSQSRIKQLTELKSCIADGLANIKEARGSHPSWIEVENFSADASTWPKYEPTTPVKK